MPVTTRVELLERRIQHLERKVGIRSREKESNRAERLIVDELRQGKNIDTVEFAVRHDLRLDYVADCLRRLARRGWAERVEA